MRQQSTDPTAKPRAKSAARIARILPLLAAQVPHSQIARITGYSLRSISRLASRPEVREAMEAAQAEARIKVRELLEAGAEVALGTLVDVMRGGDGPQSPDARVKAAVAILDRVGFGATSKLEHGGGIDVRNVPASKSEALERARAVVARLEASDVSDGVTVLAEAPHGTDSAVRAVATGEAPG
jgi:hypothetical protein